MTSPNMSFLSMTGGVRKDAFAEICEHGDLIAFLSARLDEDERELVRVAEPLRRVLLSARMRRETAFKRAILGQYRTAAGWSSDNWPLPLRLFAAIWSDHPDYDQDWAP